jgi:thiol-disulfide isomerase/thioredoxin
VTVKVTPQPGNERDHHIICVVEVKRNNDTEAKAEEQMETYMKQAANLPQHRVSEKKVSRYIWLWATWCAHCDQFTRELCEISIENWNYQS